MTRSAVHTDQAPAAIYSQAVHCGHLLFVSGTLPVDPRTGQLVGGDIEAQSRQVFRNLAAIAEAAGGQLADAVKVTVFLTDLGDFQRVSRVYREWFGEPFRRGARSGVAALPLDAPLEVEAIIALARHRAAAPAGRPGAVAPHNPLVFLVFRPPRQPFPATKKYLTGHPI